MQSSAYQVDVKSSTTSHCRKNNVLVVVVDDLLVEHGQSAFRRERQAGIGRRAWIDDGDGLPRGTIVRAG